MLTAATQKEPINTLIERPVSILVAEDSDSNQLLISLYFKGTSCELEFAANGEEAVEKHATGFYDIILMDIQMPVMNGWDATSKIRERERKLNLPPVPIVAITANPSAEDRQLALKAGCTDFYPKPIRKAELLEGVAALVRQE